ncbi:MAG: hypothetical protein V4479_12275 [Actinomycetota bacterium]
MVLKLDPIWPIVWRDPHTVQVGVDRPVAVLEQLTAEQERMVAALVAGVGRSGLDMIDGPAAAIVFCPTTSCSVDTDARPCRSPAAADAMLARLGTALIGEPVQPAGAAVFGAGRTADRLRSVLAATGTPVVIVAHYVIAPDLHSRWLRRDLPHLPVVYGDSIVRIGPFVEPGSGPCLYCLELHHTDADPAWPAIASQLLGRRAHTETDLVAIEVAATVARLVARRSASDPGAARSIERRDQRA